MTPNQINMSLSAKKLHQLVLTDSSGPHKLLMQRLLVTLQRNRIVYHNPPTFFSDKKLPHSAVLPSFSARRFLSVMFSASAWAARL